jgi:hypothetical protein
MPSATPACHATNRLNNILVQVTTSGVVSLFAGTSGVGLLDGAEGVTHRKRGCCAVSHRRYQAR